MNDLRIGRIAACSLLAVLCVGFAAAQNVPLAPLARTTRHSPNEFGTQDYTVTVIPATSFTSDDAFITDYGSLSRHFPYDSVHHQYFAGANIPSGAVIDYIGLECLSFFPGELTVTPFYLDQFSGTTSGIVALANTPHYFDTDYNVDPLGWQLVRNVHNAIVVNVDQAPNGEPWFGWVEIWWKRVVSPPPDTPTFTDVPATDFGYQYIEALKASGITGGCGDGTTFCPDASLTRRQMAIFLAKALGLHWAY